jgi:hypothetical protein
MVAIFMSVVKIFSPLETGNRKESSLLNSKLKTKFKIGKNRLNMIQLRHYVSKVLRRRLLLLRGVKKNCSRTIPLRRFAGAGCHDFVIVWS